MFLVLAALRWRRLAAAVVPAVVLGLAGFGTVVPAANAAKRVSAVPALHGTARIALGKTRSIFGNAFAEAPNGSVYYSRGTVVYVVAGTSAPRVAVRAGRRVVALAANVADLFVQTGLRVTEYRRSTGGRLRHWTLTSPAPITSAGLYAVGGTLWSWTDWATDSSGFEYAKVSRISITSAAVHVVDKFAYPGDASANSAGLFFEAQHGTSGYLGHARPSGSTSYRRLAATAVGTPLALAAGRVDLLTFGQHVRINSYRTTTLALVSSKPVLASDRSLAGTRLGLLVLAEPCPAVSCASATLSKLSVSTGAASGTSHVPGAYLLLSGPAAAVIEVSHGTMYLVRVGP
ncbi:MAG TPA: hypothetical protein VNF47_06245 [Streptosporangiaceae bacterium]|nr:hypothetical protein [Streptosporangiaceae bacterium]